MRFSTRLLVISRHGGELVRGSFLGSQYPDCEHSFSLGLRPSLPKVVWRENALSLLMSFAMNTDQPNRNLDIPISTQAARGRLSFEGSVRRLQGFKRLFGVRNYEADGSILHFAPYIPLHFD